MPTADLAILAPRTFDFYIQMDASIDHGRDVKQARQLRGKLSISLLVLWQSGSVTVAVGLASLSFLSKSQSFFYLLFHRR